MMPAVLRRDEGGRLAETGAEHMTRLPEHGDALRIAAFLDATPGGRPSGISNGVWRVSEDDPHSDLYAENADAKTVIDYMATHS